MKAVLVSFFDSNNIGDLLISDALYKKVNEHFKVVTKINYLDGKRMDSESTISIAPYTPEITEKQLSMKTKISEQLTRLNLTSINYFYLSKIKKYPLAEFEQEMKSADVLIIGGGNMVFDIEKRALAAGIFKHYIDIAKNHGKKVFAMSLGIGPFQTAYQEKAAVEALNKCDYVTLRDEKSMAIFNKHYPDRENTAVTVDPVFSMSKMIEETIHKNTVGINIINNPEYHDDQVIYEKVINGYALLAKELTEKTTKKVKLFSTQTRDYELIKKVYDRIENKEQVSIVHIHNIDELVTLYSEFSLLIAARMHSMIIAYTQLIPIVGLTWQPKVEAMFDIIDEAENCFKLTKIQESSVDIMRVVEDKLTNDYTSEMKEQLTKIRVKDEINNEILHKLANEANAVH